MNTKQVENLLRSDCKSSLIFEGVFASDRIPIVCETKTAMVLNFDPYAQTGSHWIGIYIENGCGEYFDSYGMYPPITHFVNFLNRNCTSWSFNTEELQAIDSEVCGHYCIWFLSERVRGRSMKEIVSRFSSDLKKNDLLVKELVESRFGRIASHFIDDDVTQQCCVTRNKLSNHFHFIR